MRYQISGTTLELVQGDIVLQDVDAIVNAANESLAPGGGVSGAIHRAAGPELEAECRAIGGCPAGEARITAGYRLKARHVIHAVGPRYTARPRDAELLGQAYQSALVLAEANGLRTIAFPSISTGIFGYPLDQAARVALGSVGAFLQNRSGLTMVRFVLWDDDTHSAYSYAAHKLGLSELEA
jgi:O-acetyl-ADP-ribose deacetylase (regulator of RNase III)